MNESDQTEHDDPVLLPSIEERRFAESTLASLVHAAGYEHLALAPLLLPDTVHFPDPWTGNAASLRRLLMRLCLYADLDAQLELIIHDDDDIGGDIAPAGIGAWLWLVDARGGKVKIAARRNLLGRPQDAPPAAARVVTEAWRAHRGLAASDPVAEQRLVDITAVFLGFGVLTTAASLRHGAESDATFRMRRTLSRLGIVGPHVLAFALAIQVEARSLDPRARRAIRKHLPPNQAAFFRAALELLGTRDEPVYRTVALPEPNTWAEAPSLEALTDSLLELPTAASDAPTDAHDEPFVADRGVVGINKGRPVFRVERSKAMRLARLLGLPVVMLGMMTTRMNLGFDIATWQIGAAGAALALAGLLIGRFMTDARCSEPRCGHVLTADQTMCPRCSGTISGVISHPRERLAAEEAISMRVAGHRAD